jgi:hypothetical protein
MCIVENAQVKSHLLSDHYQGILSKLGLTNFADYLSNFAFQYLPMAFLVTPSKLYPLAYRLIAFFLAYLTLLPRDQEEQEDFSAHSEFEIVLKKLKWIRKPATVILVSHSQLTTMVSPEFVDYRCEWQVVSVLLVLSLYMYSLTLDEEDE